MIGRSVGVALAIVGVFVLVSSGCLAIACGMFELAGEPRSAWPLVRTALEVYGVLCIAIAVPCVAISLVDARRARPPRPAPLPRATVHPVVHRSRSGVARRSRSDG